MSVRSDLEDAIRAWVVSAGAAGGIPTPAAKVVFADQDADPRPPLPHVLLRLLVYDEQVGEDETYVDDSDPPLITVRGRRRAVVQLNAFGDEAESWLERAHLCLSLPGILATLGAAGPGAYGVALNALGPATNLSGLLDEHYVVRWQRDYEVAYTRVGTDATEIGVPLEQVAHTDEHTGSTGTRTVVETIVLP